MATTTNLFDTSPSVLPTAIYPGGLPRNVIIALAVTLPSVTLLVTAMGIVHCLCRRSRKKQAAARLIQEAEVQGLRPPPTLVVDTHVPKLSDASQPAQSTTAPAPLYRSQGGGVFIPVNEGNMVVRLPAPSQVRMPLPVKPICDMSPLASHPPDGGYVICDGRRMKVNRGVQIGFSHK